MSEMGRPKIEFDWEHFDKLCGMQCTLEEIAGFFDCSMDTVERRVREKFDQTFAVIYKSKAAGGRSSLRRRQFQAAMEGNTALLIWLGKQYLGQSEKYQSFGPTTEDSKLTIEFPGQSNDSQTPDKAGS